MTLAIIPAFAPPGPLRERVVALQSQGFDRVLVVDDGSGAAYREVFDELVAVPQCVVLRHERNCGKGRALKTAFAYVMREMPEVDILVTVDADGQHDPRDCRRVVDRLVASSADVCLGARAFAWRTTPFRSWWGNRWTSFMFLLRRRRWFADTQTGLRAFRRRMLPRVIAQVGEGYEYEMAVLCACVQARDAIVTQRIQTIYENDNASSHYDPVRDTIRVLRTLMKRPVRVTI